MITNINTYIFVRVWFCINIYTIYYMYICTYIYICKSICDYVCISKLHETV